MIKKDLFDKSAALYVLSSLMHNPLFLQDDRYAFVKTDFYTPIQEMVFGAIYNLAITGVQKISPQDIDLYLKQYSAQYDYYRQNKGYEFVSQCFRTAEGSDIKQFDIYYNRLKKFSILRDLESVGIDTTQFYDTTKDALNRDIEDEKLNKLTIDKILNTIRNDVITIENVHIGKNSNCAQEANVGIRALVQSLQDRPEVGLPLDGDIVNWTTRGARLGKMYIYSAPSGAGKTRFMVGNACAVSMPFLNKDGEVQMREGGYQRILFVATEMQPDEIQTLILSYVSGVNEKAILLGNYSPEERARISKALDIIDVYGKNFMIECIPDPSIEMIKARLIKYIVQNDIYYIFYDYIFSSPGLLTEFKDVGVREDRQ